MRRTTVHDPEPLSVPNWVSKRQAHRKMLRRFGRAMVVRAKPPRLAGAPTVQFRPILQLHTAPTPSSLWRIATGRRSTARLRNCRSGRPCVASSKVWKTHAMHPCQVMNVSCAARAKVPPRTSRGSTTLWRIASWTNNGMPCTNPAP